MSFCNLNVAVSLSSGLLDQSQPVKHQMKWYHHVSKQLGYNHGTYHTPWEDGGRTLRGAHSKTRFIMKPAIVVLTALLEWFGTFDRFIRVF